MIGQDRYVLLTGASSTLGLELAKLFAKDGYNLLIVAGSNDVLSSIANNLSGIYGVKVVTLFKNLFKQHAAVEIYNEVRSAGIEIEILVNDAGHGEHGSFIQTDLQRELDIIQLNICSLVSLTKLFLKDMVARRSGKILNVASIAGKLPGPLQSVYHGTKAFVHSFTEAIREEVKDSCVTVTSMLPGATATDFFNKAKMLQAKNIKDRKLAGVEEVAKDGYEALMQGEDLVISGFVTK
jgi:hypothetical protein